MFYNNLGNLGSNDASGSARSSGYGVTNSSFTDGDSGDSVSILNLLNNTYWYGEEYAAFTHSPAAWAFGTDNGSQGYNGKHNSRPSWAVHDGDIGASPVPLPAGIYLFLSGLVGLGLMRGRNA